MTDPTAARLVVADDEPDIRRLVSFTLRRRGYTVLEAADGDAAYGLIARERPDLAILDVMMPGMTGIEVIRRLRQSEELAAIPVVLLSAKGQMREIEDGLGSGAAAYIVKPFTPAALARQVEGLLGARQGTETAHAHP